MKRPPVLPPLAVASRSQYGQLDLFWKKLVAIVVARSPAAMNEVVVDCSKLQQQVPFELELGGGGGGGGGGSGGGGGGGGGGAGDMGAWCDAEFIIEL